MIILTTRPGALTALILAGTRSRKTGPVALRATAPRAVVNRKALVPTCAMPMILRVIAAWRGCSGIGRLVAAAARADLFAAYPKAAGVILRASAASPSQSVATVLAEFGVPMLVTQADPTLLTTEMLDFFLASAPGANAPAAVTRADIIRAGDSGAALARQRGSRHGIFSTAGLRALEI